MKKNRHLVFTLLATSIVVMTMGSSLTTADNHIDDDDNIVTALIAAPEVANGIVAGEPTEIITVLNALGVNDKLALDPENFGHQIPAGGYVEVTLGGTFERNGVDNGKSFVPIASNAYIAIETGLPQNPIAAPAGAGVQHGNYTIIDNGDKMITVMPNGGSGDNGLEQARANVIGFKAVHIRPRPNTNVGPAPFTNGAAGTTGSVEITIYNASGDVVEQGFGWVIFPVSVGRTVGPTNVGLATGGQNSPATTTAELVESVNFQHIAPNTVLSNAERPSGGSFSGGAPYAPRFLMFEELAMQPDSYIPFKGINKVGYVVDEDKPWKAVIVEDTNDNGTPDNDDDKIGNIKIKDPHPHHVVLFYRILH